jgi:tetratricopeptide (TPR) repeat protein/CHAT domain-containing protein
MARHWWRQLNWLLRLAALAAAWHCPALAQSDEVVALTRQVQELYQAGKYAQALPLATRLTEATGKLFGEQHPRHANALGVLGDLYREMGRYAEAEPICRRALGILEAALGQDHPDVGQSLNRLGLLYWAQGRYIEAEPLYKGALSIGEKARGPDHPGNGTLLNNLAVLYVRQGRYAEAEALYQRALLIAEKALGPEHADVGRVLTHSAQLYANQGRYREAQPLLKRALAIREKALGPSHPEVAGTLNSLALLYAGQGRMAEAEPLYKRALAIDEAALGADHPNLVSRLNNLADLYRLQGLYAEAEPLYRRALAVAERALGRQHHHVGSVLNNLAWVYSAQGRYAEAEPLYQRALAVAEAALGRDHPDIGTHLHNLAALYRVEGRNAEAEPLLQRALAIGERTAPDHPNAAKALNNLAELYRAQDRATEATTLYKKALAIADKVLGPEHSDVGTYLGNLAALRLAQQDWADAVALLERATNIAITRSKRTAHSLGQPQSWMTTSETVRASDKFALLVKAAWRLSAERRSSGSEGAMFEMVQWASGSQAAASLAQMAARQAKGDTALAHLVRERQDLASEWQARDKLLLAAVSQPPAQRHAAAEQELRDRLAKIDQRIAEIDKTLAKDFPDYAVLANAEPLTVADVQSLLSADEALVMFLDTPAWKPAPEETFIWVVTKTDMRWARSELGTRALAERVQTLRCGLDPAAWDSGGAGHCRNVFKGSYSPEDSSLGKPLPFNLGTAFELYTALFSSFDAILKGKHLLIVPSGPLTSLPFQVLVTAPPGAAGSKDAGGFADAAWLVRRHATTVLPSVASLKALRQSAKASKASQPYIGFGNPLLVGPDGNDRRAWTRQSCAAPPMAAQTASRGVRKAIFALFRSGLANVEEVRAQYPLPETADELCAVAQSSGAGERSVYLGDKASEKTIKALSADGTLAGARIVHFATHGLLAGETGMLSASKAEPALILTPPPTPTEEDDGLLTASEITQLKMDADWVVLSACNTAAGESEKPGAEALSGLARAFFHAGARALLVSHWAVNSQAAVKLITKAFDELKTDSKIGRAEALRRSMLSLIVTGNVHPADWAPFIVVGEGEPPP